MRVLLLFLLGCDQAPTLPRVHVISDEDTTAQYASAWDAIGFSTSTEGGSPECSPSWYETGEIDCQISIVYLVENNLRDRAGTDALSDRMMRGVRLDSRLQGFALCVAVAHETGHIVLDTPLHTVGGVMGGSDCVLHQVDRELACSTIGACE